MTSFTPINRPGRTKRMPPDALSYIKLETQRNDPFKTLPAELKEKILADVFNNKNRLDGRGWGVTLPPYLGNRSSFQDLRNAALASAVLFRQLQYSRPKILLDAFRRDIPEDILFDAIAVLAFPDPQLGSVGMAIDGEGEEDATTDADIDWHDAITEHMARWSTGGLPVTLVDLGPNFVFRLASYLRRISGYVEDFMFKTLDYRRIDQNSWSENSYLRLPRCTNPELDPWEAPGAVRGAFTGRFLNNWQNFLKAFLQYELICLIYRPRPRFAAMDSVRFSRPGVGGLRPASGKWKPSASRASSLPFKWNFTYLAREQSKLEGNSKPWEIDRILSVFEYVASVYGAVCSRFVHKWDIPGYSLSDALMIGNCLKPQSCSGWRFLDRLSMNGLGCLDNLIRSNRADFITAMRRFDLESDLAKIAPKPRDEALRLSWGMPSQHTVSQDNKGPCVWRLGLWRIETLEIRSGGSMNGAHETEINEGRARYFKRAGLAMLHCQHVPRTFMRDMRESLNYAVNFLREPPEAMTAGQHNWQSRRNVGLTFSLQEGRPVRRRDGKSKHKKVPMPEDPEWRADEVLAEFPSLKPYLRPLWA